MKNFFGELAMKNQKYLYLVFIFLVILISIQAVSASDDLRGDIISADDEGLILEDSINEDISTAANDNEELFLDESIEEDVSTGANDDELFLDESDEDSLGSADEEAVLKESPGSFSDLNNFINVENADNTTIHLSKNYAYTDSDEDKSYVHGVSISRGLTIEGHGVTIDGAHLARIFNVGKVYVLIRNKIIMSIAFYWAKSV